MSSWHAFVKRNSLKKCSNVAFTQESTLSVQCSLDPCSTLTRWMTSQRVVDDGRWSFSLSPKLMILCEAQKKSVRSVRWAAAEIKKGGHENKPTICRAYWRTQPKFKFTLLSTDNRLKWFNCCCTHTLAFATDLVWIGMNYQEGPVWVGKGTSCQQAAQIPNLGRDRDVFVWKW